jgi:hypothetical protein
MNIPWKVRVASKDGSPNPHHAPQATAWGPSADVMVSEVTSASLCKRSAEAAAGRSRKGLAVCSLQLQGGSDGDKSQGATKMQVRPRGIGAL